MPCSAINLPWAATAALVSGAISAATCTARLVRPSARNLSSHGSARGKCRQLSASGPSGSSSIPGTAFHSPGVL